MKKPVMAVYSQTFLTISMTFIYRQMMGISEWFRPIVLTSKTVNSDAFPYSPVYEKSVNGLTNRVVSKLYRTIAGKTTFISPAQFKYWRDACRKHNVRLIHAHFGPGGLQMLALAKSLNIPLIVTFHGFDASALLKSSVYKANIKNLFDYADVICVSKFFRDRLKNYGINFNKTKIHYIGIPLEDFEFVRRKPIYLKYQNNEILRFLQVSNFVEKKGHCYTIEAFYKILKLYPKIQITFAGDGPLRKEIEGRCRLLGLSDKVTFTGKVVKKQVVELMHQSDVFVHHSITAKNGDQEGIPTVIMEAMATGLPVISTYHSGIPELIQDGVNGFLVPERDVEEYAQKIKALLKYSEDIGQRAFDKVNRDFNMTPQNEKLAIIYKEAINEHQNRS